jgi:rhodanese-related sulfurtransferase
MNPWATGVPQLSASDLKRRLDRGEAVVVLDVREDHERDYCAIPTPPGVTDLHIPMGQVQESLERLRAAAGAAPLVVYCHHGMRSMTVASWLVKRGLPGVHNLEGGIDAWSVAVDPELPRY